MVQLLMLGNRGHVFPQAFSSQSLLDSLTPLGFSTLVSSRAYSVKRLQLPQLFSITFHSFNAFNVIYFRRKLFTGWEVMRHDSASVMKSSLPLIQSESSILARHVRKDLISLLNKGLEVWKHVLA